jgi:methionyl-tRNA formyltransferase
LIAQPDVQIEGVVTQPDRPRGRGQEVAQSVVKVAALEAGLAVFQPERIRADAAFDYFQRVAPDAVVIIAYGQIIPPPLLAIPRLGWINLHASLLPKYRGAAPINWAIANGETRTGLTTMRIDSGLDTGPTLLTFETSIGPEETAPELAARLADAGAPVVVEALRQLDRGEIVPAPQDNSQATHAPPLKKEDGRIDWSLPAPQIYNRIRGFAPWPGAFTQFRRKSCHLWGKPVAPPAPPGAPGTLTATQGALLVACGGATALAIEFVQIEGRKQITAREFANGARLAPSDHFGS